MLCHEFDVTDGQLFSLTKDKSLGGKSRLRRKVRKIFDLLKQKLRGQPRRQGTREEAA